MNEKSTYALLIIHELSKRGEVIEKRDNLTEPVTVDEIRIYEYLSCCNKSILKQSLEELEKLPNDTNICPILERLGLICIHLDV